MGNFNDPGSQGNIKFTLVAKEQDEITQTNIMPEHITANLIALVTTKHFESECSGRTNDF